MPIFQTGAYRVKPSGVAKVESAIREFVDYVKKSEPGSLMYLAWQEKNDPTKFVHLFIFEDEAAQQRHGRSDAVKRFESVYSPELPPSTFGLRASADGSRKASARVAVGGGVVFTDYVMIAGKREGTGVNTRIQDRPRSSH